MIAADRLRGAPVRVAPLLVLALALGSSPAFAQEAAPPALLCRPNSPAGRREHRLPPPRARPIWPGRYSKSGHRADLALAPTPNVTFATMPNKAPAPTTIQRDGDLQRPRRRHLPRRARHQRVDQRLTGREIPRIDRPHPQAGLRRASASWWISHWPPAITSCRSRAARMPWPACSSPSCPEPRTWHW